MIEKRLGKISEIKVGFGGYDDVMFGLTFTLGNDSWGTMDFTTDFNKLKDLLKESKKTYVEQLINVPVEVTFDGLLLKEWRILTEVL